MSDTVVKFSPEEVNADPILHGMVRDKLPLTRRNYIIRNYGELPTDWNAEAESELPEKFQNWSQFQPKDRPKGK
ncbi:MAG: hypothetical protein EOP83_36695 [Verrucomicrobiaceae bacterium]|nr:MAG: hypothetical protein EOP83_36695 [Verrucomicrobiaceae bacterium]